MTAQPARAPAGRLRLAVHWPFLGIGALLTGYLAVAAFGYVDSSSQHIANFILATVAMAGLLALRDLFEARELGNRVPWYAARVATASAGLVCAVAGAAYIRFHADRLEMMQPFFEDTDIFMGAVLTAGVLLLTLVHWGWLLTSIIALSIWYLFYGHVIDNVLFMHPQYDTSFAMNYMGLGTTQGFFWLAQLASDALYFLVIYAGVLLGLGMLQLILELGKASGRHFSGGAAFPALIGSGIVASVMGQSVSNVVMTGRFTIPMMKDYGYRPSMAGAIEAMASTAGQIMPPVLGLAAFIIASLLNIAYIDVALAALIPALLFMSGVTIGVLVYARYHRLPKLDAPVNGALIRATAPTFVGSFAVVLVLLLYYYSPSLAGIAGIVVALGLCLFQGKRWRPRLAELRFALEEGLILVTILSLLLIAIGPLGQTMMTTNLSGRLGSVILEYLPESRFVLLVGAMLVSLVLGMGLPTPVAYVVGALAIVPFMQQLGVAPLQAHFFVFYFAVFSALTPPVAVSVLAAAKMANAGVLATAADAMKLAATTFIVPFAFVYSPQLMSFPNLTWSVLPPVLEILAIQVAISAAGYGFLHRRLTGWERAGFAVVALLGVGSMCDVLGYGTTWLMLFLGAGALLLASAYLLSPGAARAPAAGAEAGRAAPVPEGAPVRGVAQRARAAARGGP